MDKYEKLIKELEKLNEEKNLENVDVYFGEINGEYDREYSIDKKEVMDVIHSDGKIDTKQENENIIYNVNDANYVYIVRYKNTNDKEAPSKIENVSLLISDQYKGHENPLGEIRFYMLNYDPDLYFKVFNQGSFKGNIKDYNPGDEKGLVIVPSKELIKTNQGQTR